MTHDESPRTMPQIMTEYDDTAESVNMKHFSSQLPISPAIKTQSPTKPGFNPEARFRQTNALENNPKNDKSAQWQGQQPRKTNLEGARPRRWPLIRKMKTPQALTWTAILQSHFKSQPTMALSHPLLLR